MSETNNNPRFVLFEPDLVGWKGLSFAIKDARQLNVPLAVETMAIKKAVDAYRVNNNIRDIRVVLKSEI